MLSAKFLTALIEGADYEPLDPVIILLFAASAARADSFVQVVLEPATFPNVDTMGDETIGASFVWQTTTQVLSDFTVTANGPIAGFSIFGDAEINDSGIEVNNDNLALLIHKFANGLEVMLESLRPMSLGMSGHKNVAVRIHQSKMPTPVGCPFGRADCFSGF